MLAAMVPGRGGLAGGERDADLPHEAVQRVVISTAPRAEGAIAGAPSVHVILDAPIAAFVGVAVHGGVYTREEGRCLRAHHSRELLALVKQLLTGPVVRSGVRLEARGEGWRAGGGRGRRGEGSSL